MKPTNLIFLPGSAGNASFWQPASALIKYDASRIFIEWPGIAGVQQNTSIKTVNDLVDNISAQINQPSALIAQSMGGMVAVLALLKQPELITHLVLCVTSAGVNVKDINLRDWRENYVQTHPTYPTYFVEFDQDLTEHIQSINIPVLLIWGDNDPISPVAIGKRLQSLIKNSKLKVISNGEHNLANAFATDVAPMIETFLKTQPA